MSVRKIYLALLLPFCICVDLTNGQLVWYPCPFNELECNCTDVKPPTAFAFHAAQCASTAPATPTFTPDPNNKYTITGALEIRANVYDIPAGHFAAFQSIDTLGLEQIESGQTMTQQWNESAFDGVKIDSFFVQGLAGVIPPPAALIRLGPAGLTQLDIADAKTPVQLSDGIFQDFHFLTKLSIGQTPITSIGDHAFDDVKYTLLKLDIYNASLNQYPATALNILKQLTNLGLRSNGITTIPDRAFLAFPELRVLSLGGNNLAAAINQGALDALPASVIALDLPNVGLTAIPKRIMHNQPSLNSMTLSDNPIERIKVNDLWDCKNMQVLSLNGNPIWNIDYGAFAFLHEVFILSLRNTHLVNVDLSIFAGLESGMYTGTGIYLGDTASLKRLYIADLTKYPKGASIEATNTALETIDDEIGDLLGLDEDLSIDISNNVNLQCTNFTWMAYYVSCTDRLKIDGAKCADQPGQPYLADYLTTIAPDVVCLTTPPSVSTSVEATTQTTIPSTSTGHSGSGVSRTAGIISLITALAALATGLLPFAL